MNIAQTRLTVKSAAAGLIPNPNHIIGQNLAYKQLKAAGWTSATELHPTDRVPVFHLSTATIRRNRTGASHWLLELPGHDTLPITDVSVAEITEAVKTRLAELHPEPVEGLTPAPQPLTPAAIEAAALTTEYPELTKRIAAALALVEAGVTDFAQYKTEWQNLTRDGNWVCECPDATRRNPRFAGGVACKHALAGEIARRIKRNQRRVAMQKLADKTQRREYNDYAKPSDYNQPADPMNRARRGNQAEFKVRYG